MEKKKGWGGWNKEYKEGSGTKWDQEDDHIGSHKIVKAPGLYLKSNEAPLKGFQWQVTGLELLSP